MKCTKPRKTSCCRTKHFTDSCLHFFCESKGGFSRVGFMRHYRRKSTMTLKRCFNPVQRQGKKRVSLFAKNWMKESGATEIIREEFVEEESRSRSEHYSIKEVPENSSRSNSRKSEMTNSNDRILKIISE